MLNARSVGPKASCRTTRAIGGHGIVVASIRSKGVGRADSYRRRFITRGMNLTIHLLSHTVFSVITGRGNDHYAGIDQLTYGLAHRVIFIRIYCWRAEAHIHDPDVIGCTVSQYPVERAKKV